MKTPEECVQDILKFESTLPTCTRCNGRGYVIGWFGNAKDCKCHKGKEVDWHSSRHLFDLGQELRVCQEIFAIAEGEINKERLEAHWAQQEQDMRDNIEQAKQYLRDKVVADAFLGLVGEKK